MKLPVINEKGLALLKRFEGCRLVVYKDAVGLHTVGWGHMDPALILGTKITQEEADSLLKEDLERFERGVYNVAAAPISSNEFSALVCFAYNVGLGAFANSTLLSKLNAGDKAGAAKEFLKWTRAGGTVLRGLVKRRQAEMELFLEKDV